MRGSFVERLFFDDGIAQIVGGSTIDLEPELGSSGCALRGAVRSNGNTFGLVRFRHHCSDVAVQERLPDAYCNFEKVW